MLDLLINHYISPKRLLEDVICIFRKEASKNQIAQWKKTYDKLCTWRANPHKRKVIGKHQFIPMSKAVTFDCGYTNPSMNTDHGARHCGIFAVGNVGVGPSTVKQFTCHTKIDRSTTYHESDDADQMRAVIAVQGLYVNDTVNVANDDGYNNVDDDNDDQPIQRQNQPSQHGRYPNPSSFNNQSITSPNKKRSKFKNHSPTRSRSPASSHSSYDSCHHHHRG